MLSGSDIQESGSDMTSRNCGPEPTPAERIPLGPDTYVAVLTGAGVSAESGIATFRDSKGLWESHRVEDVATMLGFIDDPLLVWRFYSDRRKQALAVHPNPAHVAFGRAALALGDRFLLLTQNVDDLHERGGVPQVHHYHGDLFTTSCLRQCAKGAAGWRDTETHYDSVPRCPHCGSDARPAVVWFGESIPVAPQRAIAEFFDRARAAGGKLFFVVAGTSNNVFPAAAIVHDALRTRATCVFANAEETSSNPYFHRFHKGKASEVISDLF